MYEEDARTNKSVMSGWKLINKDQNIYENPHGIQFIITGSGENKRITRITP